MRRALPFLLLALAACGEAVEDDHFANDVSSPRAEPKAIAPGAVPVRIGELGANFNACNLVGTSRGADAASGEQIEVRAAPFEASERVGSIPANARFYICTRSHDQRWLGIVYDDGGALSPGCGVSRPVTSRRAYEGPCRSGWVSSAFVKQVAS